jgi:hypothetical protein
MDPDPGGPKTFGSCGSRSGSPRQIENLGCFISARTNPREFAKICQSYLSLPVWNGDILLEKS